MLQEEVGIETYGGDVINYIRGGLHEVQFVWTRNEPEKKINSI